MKKIKTIALVAPSGNIKDIDIVNKKISFLEKKFKIKKYYKETKDFEYLADSDENRAKYFTEAFLDDEVDLILPVRGGFGALRIVDKINWGKIKNSNKVYIGSSDSTILLMALDKKTNTKCYHGLMLSNGFCENLEKNIEIIENNIFDINLSPIKSGKCEGRLWGGNLSSLVSVLCNDKYLPNDDIILFLEDLNEPKYKIDKMFYEIYRNRKLKNKIKGIIFGDFYLEEKEITPLIKEYANMFDVAAFATKDITHKENNVCLPYGYFVSLQSLIKT